MAEKGSDKQGQMAFDLHAPAVIPQAEERKPAAKEEPVKRGPAVAKEAAVGEPEEPKIHSVSEITRRVRQLLEGGIGEAWVEGEISNLRVQSSGHQYFTLKDGKSQLACVLFAGNAAGTRGGKLSDGELVQVFGAVTVYEARGQYQMIVRQVQLRGAGALQARFEALKRQLSAEGLFDEERKRAIPPFPGTIGVVTSPTGAAIRDFLHVLGRRQPGIGVIINPVRVQGAGAAAEIAAAVREFNDSPHLPRVDVIVVTRGGGSIEDLWEFNEEVVARAIADSQIPVVSAVGHEIDFTIADFVADLRAPTPSAGAEILAADRAEVLARIGRDARRLQQYLLARMELAGARVAAFRQSALFREPQRRIFEMRQSLDRAQETLGRSVTHSLGERKHDLGEISARLVRLSPQNRILETSHRAALSLRRLGEMTAAALAQLRARSEKAGAMLATLSPNTTLARGFTMTTDETGRLLTSAAEISVGTVLRTKFHDGEVRSVMKARSKE